MDKEIMGKIYSHLLVYSLGFNLLQRDKVKEIPMKTNQS